VNYTGDINRLVKVGKEKYARTVRLRPTGATFEAQRTRIRGRRAEWGSSSPSPPTRRSEGGRKCCKLLRLGMGQSPSWNGIERYYAHG